MDFRRPFRGFTGGKERGALGTSDQLVKVEPIDPDRQRLIFIASDVKRVPNDLVSEEIDIVFRDRTIEQRQDFVRQVGELRQPKEKIAGQE